MSAGVAERSRSELARAGGAAFLDLLAQHLAVKVPGLLGAEECERWLRRIRSARPFWIEDFGGDQFSLGRAWYTHLESDRVAEYLAGAAASDAVVERFLPGLQGTLEAALAALVGAPLRRRPGFCGPGVHIFPAGAAVSERGGSVHCDHEGLTPEQLRSGAPALSAVLMLQPPEEGGGLRLWDLLDPEVEAEDEIEGCAWEDVEYGAGDLVVFDSRRVHQIQPFEGEQARVSMTAHLVRTGAGWDCWF